MIQAKDLRIGNKIIANGLHGGRIMTVEQIGGKGTLRDDKRVITFKEHDTGEFVFDCDGIVLTPELLVKCGFEKKIILGNAYGFWYEKDGLSYNESHKNWWYRGTFTNGPKYIHQLQNLYYWLTGGEELIINI